MLRSECRLVNSVTERLHGLPRTTQSGSGTAEKGRFPHFFCRCAVPLPLRRAKNSVMNMKGAVVRPRVPQECLMSMRRKNLGHARCRLRWKARGLFELHTCSSLLLNSLPLCPSPTPQQPRARPQIHHQQEHWQKGNIYLTTSTFAIKGCFTGGKWACSHCLSTPFDAPGLCISGPCSSFLNASPFWSCASSNLRPFGPKFCRLVRKTQSP